VEEGVDGWSLPVRNDRVDDLGAPGPDDRLDDRLDERLGDPPATRGRTVDGAGACRAFKACRRSLRSFITGLSSITGLPPAGRRGPPGIVGPRCRQFR